MITHAHLRKANFTTHDMIMFVECFCLSEQEDTSYNDDTRVSRQLAPLFLLICYDMLLDSFPIYKCCEYYHNHS